MSIFYGLWSWIFGNYEGEHKEWHSNGQLSTHEFYKNGKLDGECKEWFEDGQLYIYEFYKNGQLDGEYKSGIIMVSFRLMDITRMESLTENIKVVCEWSA